MAFFRFSLNCAKGAFKHCAKGALKQYARGALKYRARGALIHCASTPFAKGAFTLGATGALMLAASSGIATAQNVISSNSTIRNSLCVGFNCADAESYASDTIRLKESRVQIHFDDTSADPYPSNDWRLLANDANSNGQDYFAIEDATAGRRVFTLEGNAPSNALYVASTGNLGIGTSNPAVDIHAISSDTPILRLEQDTSSSFVAQSWDIAANENGFYVRDVTDGTTTPLRIRARAPSGSLYIDTTGEIGLGTVHPETSLHMRGNSGNTALLIEEIHGDPSPRGLLTMKNNGIVYMTLEDTSIPAGDNTGRSWNFQNQGGTFRVTTAPGGPNEIEMMLEPDGDMHIKGELYTGTGGSSTTCSAGCDRVFDADYPLPSIEEQRDMMFANRHLPNVGPTPESGPMNLSAKVGGMLNELEKAHIYIARLHDEMQQQRDELAALRASLEMLAEAR